MKKLFSLLIAPLLTIGLASEAFSQDISCEGTHKGRAIRLQSTNIAPAGGLHQNGFVYEERLIDDVSKTLVKYELSAFGMTTSGRYIGYQGAVSNVFFAGSGIMTYTLLIDTLLGGNAYLQFTTDSTYGGVIVGDSIHLSCDKL